MKEQERLFSRYINTLDDEQLRVVLDAIVHLIDGDAELGLKEMKKCLFGFLSEQEKKEVIQMIESGNERMVLPYLKDVLGSIAWEGCRRKSGF